MLMWPPSVTGLRGGAHPENDFGVYGLGIIWGFLYRGHIGIMEKKMETTVIFGLICMCDGRARCPGKHDSFGFEIGRFLPYGLRSRMTARQRLS